MSFVRLQKDICRLCTNHGWNYNPIFSSNEDALDEKIHKCLPIRVHPDDELPTSVCSTCLESLNIAEKLITNCILADSILRKQLIGARINKTEQNHDRFRKVGEGLRTINVTNTHRLDVESPNDSDHRRIVRDENNAAFESSTQANAKNDDSNTNIIIIGDILQEQIQIKEENIPPIESIPIVIDMGNGIYHENSVINSVPETNVNDSTTNTNVIGGNERNSTHPTNNADKNLGCSATHNNKTVNSSIPGRNEVNNSNKDVDMNNTVYEEIEIKEEIISPSDNVFTRPTVSPYCNTCNITILENPLRALHEKFHQRRHMQCKICRHVLPSPYELYLHQKSSHNIFQNVKMKWFCDKCEVIIGHPNRLKSHLNHCGRIMNRCRYCHGRCITKDDLLKHIIRLHYDDAMKDPNMEKFKCEICMKGFLCRKQFKSHTEFHRLNGDHRHKCRMCDQTFPHSYILKEHLNKYHRPQSFVCNICSSRFRSNIDLRRHKMTHMAFECNECKKVFDDTEALAEHYVKAHECPDVYCDYCKQKFGGKKALKEHIPVCPRRPTAKPVRYLVLNSGKVRIL